MLWGLIATVIMTSILEASRGLGFSRLSLPFLIGTFFTGNRSRAVIVGFIIYTIGGWLFAFLYFLLFASVGIYTWWFGALAGFVHGLFLLVTALPLLPFVHPRMASEYHPPVQVVDSNRLDFWPQTMVTIPAEHPLGSDHLRRDFGWIYTTAADFKQLAVVRHSNLGCSASA